MKEYYFLTGKDQNGPFSIEELKTKNLTSETLIWSDDMDNWKKLKDIPELLNLKKVPPPPPVDMNKKNVFSKWILKYKITIISVFCLILLASAFFVFNKNNKKVNKKEKHTSLNDLEDYDLNGKVKSLKISSYAANGNFNECQKNDMIYSDLLIFNKQGNIVEKYEYNRDGSLFDKYIYKYNTQGKKTEENRYDSNDILFNTIKYKYDINNNLIEEVENEHLKNKNSVDITLRDFRHNSKNYIINYSSFYSKDTYKYDNKNNRIEERSYTSDTATITLITYKYDENGNEIEYNYNSSLGSNKVTFKYDDNGNKIEASFNNDVIRDGKYKYTYKYDDNGNEIEECEFKLNGSFSSKRTFEYDDNGNKIEEIKYNADGSISTKEISKYDNENNLTEETVYNSDNSVNEKNTFKIEYDKNNNYTKKISFENGKPIDYYEREIEYY
ncbi:MAG TPA: GYF domain-containing protein [Bacteroidales bacterium]|nr:GYF domain-containing protein [Bacteroidales bacterium]HPS17213.1 GYF domain-containing protein [Bacteroidales bacterium]